MISIRKYLDAKDRTPADGDLYPEELLAASMECYRAVLLAMARSAAQVGAGFGADLETSLRGIEQRLAYEHSAEQLRQSEQIVEVHLQEWGTRSAEHFKAQAQVVKELFVALARTAESVGSRDQGFSSHYRELVGRLERIADLDDLAQIRSSIMKSATELKSSVDQLTRNHHQLVEQLQAEISTYEAKLRSAEPLAFKDELTGMANRRILEDRIRLNIENGQEFCIVMLDVNQLKQVNAKHGRAAGDDLLKQFAKELRMNTRASDLVGRWGGGEFIIVLAGDPQSTKVYVARLRDWVFGKYTVAEPGHRALELRVDASVGTAEWRAGKSVEQLIAEADAAMYLEKNRSHPTSA
ncbi:MAG TPA: GGDEF domain-containing protein [Terracidiphilus sp.]|nr:GGDEF domain-containing protein [Terracidiphilus sp.]